jgi:REP element-mobilizing transposase RayT
MDKGFPKRKPNRLEDYDYSLDGAYFVTICAKNHMEIFAKINVGAAICRPRSYTNCRQNTELKENGSPYVQLSRIGYTIDEAINNIPTKYPLVFVDIYVIMPNHVHMILVLENGRQVAAPTVSVQTIIGHMKRFVSMRCGFTVWQKSYYDHIIRNENDYREIAEYIEGNPQRWTEDILYNYKNTQK